jgi:hypothetical protein
MKLTRLLQLAFVTVVGGNPALAGAITWDINATLSDGATVTGYFVFNPDGGSGQLITNFNIEIGAATTSFLVEPGETTVPTSIFPAYDFTPSNSSAEGDNPNTDGSYAFISNTFSYGNESLVLSFVPVSPLTDANSTTIDNSGINVNDPYSAECFDCDPYVCFAGATSTLCASASSAVPEPGGLPLVACSIGSLIWALTVMGRMRSNEVSSSSTK